MTETEKVLKGPYWEWWAGCVLLGGHVVVDVCRKYGVTVVTTSDVDWENKELKAYTAEYSPKALRPDIYEPATVGIMLHLARKRLGDDFQPIRVEVSGGPDFFVAYAGGPTFKHEEDLLWDALIPEEPTP